MVRRIVCCGIAVGAILSVTAWDVGRPAAVAQNVSPAALKNKGAPPAPAARPSAEARVVAQASATAPLPIAATSQRRRVVYDPIVAVGRLSMIDQEDVPSQRDGVLLVIGTEMNDGEQYPPHEIVRLQVENTTKTFRRLKEGDYVQADQLLALVDDTLARADEAIKEAKVTSAEADKVASEKTREEAKSRYETQQKLYGSNAAGIRATSKEDLTGALLTYNKYVYETISKEEAIKVAKQELIQAQKTRSMYEIRPKISGIVKAINKHRGEAVKSLDTLLQIQDYDHLRVDAWLQEQYASRLDKGTEIVIEPTFRESPRITLVGHRGVVTGVAVSTDRQKPRIASCSEDRTVRIWELSPDGRVQESAVLNHPARVRAVACSATLCLSGDEQGKARLWDLNDRSGDKPLRELKGDHHRKAITSVAFSPNGQTCATGGEDNEILLWDTASGDLRYRILGHHNIITALHFASDSRLISVGRDAVHFWNLSADRYELDKATFARRGEPLVYDLGLSPDGRYMMDEQGGDMRIVSLPAARTETILRSPLGKRFVNFALFSPDGRTALTTPQEASQAGGMLELWRIDYKGRSHALRQFISPTRGVAKCAAFSPDGSFVVAAINDRLDVWPMPDKEEVDQRITGIITNVGKPIEAVGENQVKVTAELKNPDQRLRPGDIVTVVVYPPK
jgi:WD40 repeat protein